MSKERKNNVPQPRRGYFVNGEAIKSLSKEDFVECRAKYLRIGNLVMPYKRCVLDIIKTDKTENQRD